MVQIQTVALLTQQTKQNQPHQHTTGTSNKDGNNLMEYTYLIKPPWSGWNNIILIYSSTSIQQNPTNYAH